MSEGQAPGAAAQAPDPAPLTLAQKARRLWQPKHPAFWMMLALNAATSALAWISQTMPLATPARLVIALFAIGNLWLGLKCARTLLQSPIENKAAEM